MTDIKWKYLGKKNRRPEDRNNIGSEIAFNANKLMQVHEELSELRWHGSLNEFICQTLPLKLFTIAD